MQPEGDKSTGQTSVGDLKICHFGDVYFICVPHPGQIKGFLLERMGGLFEIKVVLGGRS